MLFLTSAGYDSIIGFDLDKQEFNWAMHVRSAEYRFSGSRFDPMGQDGPVMMNKMHLNTVFCNEHGMYITGLRTGGMLHFNGSQIGMSAQLPEGTHNAQPFRDGVLFNDTDANALRYTGRGEGEEDRAFEVPSFELGDLQEWDPSRNPIARPQFARGLCVLNDRIVAGGSSPSTVSLYDLAGNSRIGSVTLTKDVRNAIHGLAVWPY